MATRPTDKALADTFNVQDVTNPVKRPNETIVDYKGSKTVKVIDE